jgi:hypothetical protein
VIHNLLYWPKPNLKLWNLPFLLSTLASRPHIHLSKSRQQSCRPPGAEVMTQSRVISSERDFYVRLLREPPQHREAFVVSRWPSFSWVDQDIRFLSSVKASKSFLSLFVSDLFSDRSLLGSTVHQHPVGAAIDVSVDRGAGIYTPFTRLQGPLKLFDSFFTGPTIRALPAL